MRGEVLGRTTFHEVAGEGERGAGEADKGDLAFAGDDTHGLEHVGEVGFGLEGPKASQVLGRAKRTVDDRAPSRHDLDADSDRGEGHDDVGEQDGRVDAVTAYRLQCELGRELRLGDGLQDVAVAAQAAVLGKRPARLAHEPHRRAPGR